MEDIDLDALESPHSATLVEIEQPELPAELELIHAREHLEAAAAEMTQASEVLAHHLATLAPHERQPEAGPPAPISWDDVAPAPSDTVEPYFVLATVATLAAEGAAAHDACATTSHDPASIAPLDHSTAPGLTQSAIDWANDPLMVPGGPMGDGAGIDVFMPINPTLDTTGSSHLPTHSAAASDIGGFADA